jgi:uncharacterized protein YcbX
MYSCMYAPSREDRSVDYFEFFLAMLIATFRVLFASADINILRDTFILLSIASLLLIGLRQHLLTCKRPKHLHETLSAVSSNLADETDDKYDKPESDTTPGSIRVKALYIYPIKSCHPIELQRAILTKTGFTYDRCFSFAVGKTAEDWRFISQRTKPGMALIEQQLWLPHSKSDPDHESVKMGGYLIVSFPDPDIPSLTTRVRTILEEGSWSAQPRISFTIPLKPTPDQIDKWGLRIKNFKLHEQSYSGLDYGDLPEVAAVLPKLKKHLQIPDKEHLTLMACTQDTLHPTSTNLAPLAHIGSPAQKSYTDQQPLHLINISSVHAASKLLPIENQPLSALRFRPNIFLTGAPAYSEERWKRFRVLPRDGKAERHSTPSISVVCRTSRCTMPNVEPSTGRISYEIPPPGRKRGKPQPSTMLVERRMVEEKEANPSALGYMGVHCAVEDSSFGKGRDAGEDVFVEVGDEVEVFETGEHYWGSTAGDY